MILSVGFAVAFDDLQGETENDSVCYFSRQIFFAAVGVGVMLIYSCVPMAVCYKSAFPASVGLPASVRIVGTVFNGRKTADPSGVYRF